MKSNVQSRISNSRGYDAEILLGEELFDLIESLHGKLSSACEDQKSQAEFQQ